jgi:glycosyltransferase involved in cell wall biosynthesis
MHVLITVNAAWNIWNFRRSLVASLVKDGHQVTVLAPPDETVAELERAGCRVVPLAMDVRGLNPFADLALLWRFRTIFLRERPDIVLGYTIKNNIFGALAAKSVSLPFVPNVTGLGTAFLSGGPLQRVAEGLYRLAFRSLPVVFFQNDEDEGLFLQRGLVRAAQAHVLPGSGIDLDRFRPTQMPASGNEAPIFLMVARLLRDKGVVEFVEAARKMKAEVPLARFQLLGPTGAENRTAIPLDEVKAWEAEGVVEYLGVQEDVRPFVRAASAVVLPSYREGAPRTLIEASAMARPVIATDVPGCRAVVEPEVTGFLCKVRDADSLALAMGRFLAMSVDARAAMGAAARQKMEREFDEGIVLAAYRSVIQSVAMKG